MNVNECDYLDEGYIVTVTRSDGGKPKFENRMEEKIFYDLDDAEKYKKEFEHKFNVDCEIWSVECYVNILKKIM